MTRLRLLMWFGVIVATGFAAGILFVGVCTATVGPPMDNSPAWLKTLAALSWLPP